MLPPCSETLRRPIQPRRLLDREHEWMRIQPLQRHDSEINLPIFPLPLGSAPVSLRTGTFSERLGTTLLLSAARGEDSSAVPAHRDSPAFGEHTLGT